MKGKTLTFKEHLDKTLIRPILEDRQTSVGQWDYCRWMGDGQDADDRVKGCFFAEWVDDSVPPFPIPIC